MAKSITFCKIDRIAREQEGVLLAPSAMSMIDKAYGKRAWNMKPTTLARMVRHLCMSNGYEVEQDEIVDAVNSFLES